MASNNINDPERTPLITIEGRSRKHNSNNLVELNGPDDPLNPQNSMPQWRKWLCATLLGSLTFAATFSSAVFAAVAPALARELNTTPEHIALATSLFIFGFAAGPVIMGPASEVYGRKIPLFAGYFAFVLFQIPVATAHDVRTILIWRFLAGVASSGSPAIVGGYLADFLRPVERGVAVAIFAATTLVGPPAGAMVGSLLLQTDFGWRWAVWLSMFMAAFFAVAGYIVVPETYMPILLQRKARQLRFETGNWAIHAKVEETPVSLREFVVKYLTRPFAMLFKEPILMLMTLYVSFTFGMVYFLFVAYSFSFVHERGFDSLHGSLPLVAVILGIIIGSVYVTHYTFTTYVRKIQARGTSLPEDRLPPMMVGAAILPIGLFGFAGTSSPAISPWPQIVSGVLIGAGIQIITLQVLAYIIDIYTVNANSAISGTVIVRSILGGLFPLIGVPMYQKLGAQNATSIVGIVAVVFFIIPVVLYFKGAKIRSLSTYVQKA